MKNALVGAVLAVAVATSVAGCSKDEATAGPAVGPKIESVALVDVAAGSPATCEVKAHGTVRAGTVSFFLNNAAAEPVTLAVVDGSGKAHELGDMEPGSTGGKDVDLAAGSYTPRCTVAGTALAATGTLTVS